MLEHGQAYYVYLKRVGWGIDPIARELGWLLVGLLRFLLEMMIVNKFLRAKLWLNNITFSTLYAVMEDLECTHFISQGRISCEDGSQGRLIEKRAAELMRTENNLQKLSQVFHDWIGVEAKSTEQEITNAVMEEFAGVALQPTKLLHIENDKISTLVEFDGIVSTGNTIYVIEAKHRVTQKHIDNDDEAEPGLIQRLGRLNDYLSSLHSYVETQYSKVDNQNKFFSRLRDQSIVGVIGGVHFDGTLRTFAKRLGLKTVYANGGRYAMD
jgi:hypothetical protein